MQRFSTSLAPTRRRLLPLLLPSQFRPINPYTRFSRYSTSTMIAPAVPFRTHIGPLPSSTSDPLTPNAHVFWHAPTSTWTYIIVCPTTKRCVIIDPALDYDSSTQTISTESADALLAFIREQAYQVEKILETHAHADHLTSARYLQLKLAQSEGGGGGGPANKVDIGIGEKIKQTQEYFAKKYEVKEDELEGAFDKLWKDGETFTVGECEAKVLHLPGHTADHVGYQFASFCFVGDSIFLPTVGSARADFPFGSPETLFASSQKLLSLPSTTRLFSGHHYPSSTESNVCSATVKEQKEMNRHLKEGMAENEFVKMRKERDGGLDEPKLLHQSLQVNIRGGRIPRDRDGKPFLRVPVKVPEGL
ncbi:MBL fold metallo-hydrolase [Sporobolomyces salmoneus]|uniref:MBL fold metallo-hydrolase n=1 Tax=Sporobolomyces salmoneus TaxID=183962 RepID=UPI003180CD31